MSLKWCARTGALLICAVVAIYAFFSPPKDEPGVKRRWWNGTVESVERVSGGKVMRRTNYGDDGTTVVRDEQYDRYGRLQQLSVRREDGKMEEQSFNEGVVIEYRLLSGDLSVLLEERSYNREGKLKRETKRSDDGRIVLSDKRYYDDGKPMAEALVTPTGEQTNRKWYESGKLRSEQKATLQGTIDGTDYYESGKVSRKLHQDAETGLRIERFAENGATTLIWLEPKAPEQIVTTVYENGKPAFRQTFTPAGRGFDLSSVEIINESGKTTRKLVVDGRSVTEVHDFRETGTLSRVKELTRSGKAKVTRTYDDSGKEVVSEAEGGEDEQFDDKLFKLPKAIERDDL